MYNVTVAWKSFKIHVGKLNSKLKSVAGPDYCGLTASQDSFTVHFIKIPSQEYINRMQMAINELSPVSEEAKFNLDAHIDRAITIAKTNILLADLSALIVAERKLLMNMELSNEDKIELTKKYP